jgi:hypothetical protein
MLGGLATFPDVCKLSFSLRIRGWTRRAERKCNPQLQNSFWNSDLEARVGVERALRVFKTLPSLVRNSASQELLVTGKTSPRVFRRSIEFSTAVVLT